MTDAPEGAVSTARNDTMRPAAIEYDDHNQLAVKCHLCPKVKVAQDPWRALYLLAFHYDRRHPGWTHDGDIFAEVRAERHRAHLKHGDTSMESSPATDPVGRRHRVLVEEVGEVAKEFNDAEHDGRPVDLAKVRKELIQVAAMAAAWADACGAES